MFSLFVHLKIRLTPEIWDLLSGFFYQFHSLGVREAEEPPPEGEAALHTGDEFLQAISVEGVLPPQEFEVYFQNRSDAERAFRAIFPHIEQILEKYSIEAVEEKDYSESWKENFKPMPVEPCWYVRAPWQDKCPGSKRIEILIEPGMAFGTGSHETTQSCLELIAKSIGLLKPRQSFLNRCLDFGCGSGILAIAIKKLGVTDVYGVDIDPLSIEGSLKNAALNQVEIHVGHNYPKELFFDLVVANILKNTVLEFADTFSKIIRPKGQLILSGLLKEQGDTIVDHYSDLGFSVLGMIEKNEWVSFLMQKS